MRVRVVLKEEGGTKHTAAVASSPPKVALPCAARDACSFLLDLCFCNSDPMLT